MVGAVAGGGQSLRNSGEIARGCAPLAGAAPPDGHGYAPRCRGRAPHTCQELLQEGATMPIRRFTQQALVGVLMFLHCASSLVQDHATFSGMLSCPLSREERELGALPADCRRGSVRMH